MFIDAFHGYIFLILTLHYFAIFLPLHFVYTILILFTYPYCVYTTEFRGYFIGANLTNKIKTIYTEIQIPKFKTLTLRKVRAIQNCRILFLNGGISHSIIDKFI